MPQVHELRFPTTPPRSPKSRVSVCQLHSILTSFSFRRNRFLMVLRRTYPPPFHLPLSSKHKATPLPDPGPLPSPLLWHEYLRFDFLCVRRDIILSHDLPLSVAQVIEGKTLNLILLFFVLLDVDPCFSRYSILFPRNGKIVGKPYLLPAGTSKTLGMSFAKIPEVKSKAFGIYHNGTKYISLRAVSNNNLAQVSAVCSHILTTTPD